MKRILLDTSALLKQPQLLSKSAPDTQLIITIPILNEISNYPLSGSGVSLRSAAEKALDAGILELSLLSPKELKQAVPPKTAFAGVWNDSDRHLLASAAAYKASAPNDEIYVATEDKRISNQSTEFGVQTISSSQVEQLLSSGKSDESIVEEVKDLSSRRRRAGIYNLLAGIVVGVLVNYLYSYFSLIIRSIVESIKVWGTLLGIPLFAVLLYWTRSHFRLFYGISEFLFGGVISLRLFLPDFDYTTISPVFFLQVLGGLYVMVRGLDNVSRGLRGTFLSPYVSRWFPE